MSENNQKAQIVIIGGGVIGLSIAYHLGHLGIEDVELLERQQLTSGTSWHAAGIVGPLRASMNLTVLAKYGIDLYQKLEQETGQATGYRQTGGLWLAQNSSRLAELRRISAMGERNQLETEMLTPDQIKQRFELLHTRDLAGGMWVEQDGQINPVDLCMAYARGARSKGVAIRENANIIDIESEYGAVKAVCLDDGTRIECEKLVICAGSWSRQLGKLVGVNIPLVSCKHIYVVTEPVEKLPATCPVVRDLDSGIYIKEDSGKLVLGTFESNPEHWMPGVNDAPFLMFDENWDHVQPMLEAGLLRLPAMGELGITHFMSGPESFTPDTRQIMGETPELKNCFVAAGFNSIGVMSSAGVGKVMADWIRDNEAPMDLWEVDITRLDPLTGNDDFLKSRLSESVFNQFDMHWPYKQYQTGRNQRQSPWHHLLEKKGAVFGAPTGWERPLWYALGESDKNIRYSYNAQNWWAASKSEALHCMRHVSLFELSPFTKIEIEGPDALALLQYLCCNNIDIELDKAVYTLMLNQRGGIEAEITVTRLSSLRFWIFSGAATRFKDLYWIRKNCCEFRDVVVSDITQDYAVLGIMGPKSRDLLGKFFAIDMSEENFPFSSSREIVKNDIRLRATRLSFTGELGWELAIPIDHANKVYENLLTAGENFQPGHAGHFCLDSCRLEKGFGHWGHDMGPDETPFETGLQFVVDLDKSSDFIGCKALLLQKETGCFRHLLLCEVLTDSALILHDEPVYCRENLVGFCTSGGQGFRTEKLLCFVLFKRDSPAHRAQAMREIKQAEHEIEIAGERFPIRVLEKPPYQIS